MNRTDKVLLAIFLMVIAFWLFSLSVLYSQHEHVPAASAEILEIEAR